MIESPLLAIAAVIVLGVAAQWLAWRLHVPSILLLLVVGFVAGVTGLMDPDVQFGEGLLPFVSLAVALILYEGGLTLRFAELKGAGRVVWSLVTLGAVVTWVVAALAAALLLGLPLPLAILLGAILVVTGPTVIGPLLQHIRPTGPAGSILKWEGIVIDPIGAMLAVLVFEVIRAGTAQEATRDVTTAAALVVIVGGIAGFGAGMILAMAVRWYLVPRFLENAVSVMLVVGVYSGCEQIQSESGLLATTVMGITLANQKLANVHHIVEFKENLRVLLISSLFVLLAARLDLEDFADIGPASIVFVVVLVVIGRPLSVFLSTIGSSLTKRERLFLAWMAPRGIVAAAVSSVFALELAHEGYHGAAVLVPLTFIVIVGTVLLYGITGPLVARRLGVAVPNPQGILLVGASRWCRAVAQALVGSGYRVVLVDTNRANIASARMAGLETYADSILAEHALDDLDLGGIGRLVAATPNEWVNVLAVQRLAPIFGRENVFQVATRSEDDRTRVSHEHMRGRSLFEDGPTCSVLEHRVAQGAIIKRTPITETFTYESFREQYGEKAMAMFVIKEKGQIVILTADGEVDAEPGDVLISLVEE